MIESERKPAMTDGVQTVQGARRRARRKGQGIVELALLTPMLVFMLLITVDFARAYSAYIQVSNAARAGAIYGARSSGNANDAVAVRDAALADSPTIYGTSPTVTSSTATDGDGYEQITITVNYTFSVLTGFPGLPATVDLSRSVQMRVIG